MRITQGYVSKSVMSFPFHEIYALDDYNSWEKPSVFFGMYRYEDLRLVEDNKEEKIIFWTGQDVQDCTDFPKAINVTAHPKVYRMFNDLGLECQLVTPSTFLNAVQPQQLGPKIYAYCPRSAEDYHGKKALDELRLMGYDILIGDGSIPQHLWKHSQDGFYADIFVGLCLSDFAGGGTSIIEMGLRGIPVITNVFDLPNCIPWTDAQHIALFIEGLKSDIGKTNEKLANDVWNELDHEHNWLDI